MSTQEKRDLNSIPVGSLGMIPLDNYKLLGEKIDQYLVKWRAEREREHKDSLAFAGYQRGSYILKAKVPRFGSGEGKGVIQQSVRGYDLYIMADVTNHSLDDMISSGDSMLEVAAELKARKANRIFVFSTFGLFTNGLEKFDKAYEDGLITKVFTTNLIYQTPELLSKEWYVSTDMSKYIAYLIDTLNHDASISDLLNPSERINHVVNGYKVCK